MKVSHRARPRGRAFLLAIELVAVAVFSSGCSTTIVIWNELGSGQIRTSTGNILASNQYAPGGLATDGYNVYWASSSGLIQSVPVTGGTITTLTSTWVGAMAITFDYNSSSLMWSNVNNGIISSMPTAGGTPVTLMAGQAPINIVADATNVYWTDPGAGRVWQCQKSKCLATAKVVYAQMFANSQVGVPWGIAVDGANIYFTDNTRRTVNQLPIGGGTPLVLADTNSGAFPNPAGILVDSAFVYWVNAPGGAIHKVPIGGGAVTQLVASSSVPADANCGDSCTTMTLATDGSNLYWADYSSGQINSVSKSCAAPCTATTVATGNGPIGLVAVVKTSGI